MQYYKKTLIQYMLKNDGKKILSLFSILKYVFMSSENV